MQISDMLNTYNQNVTPGTEGAVSVKNVQQLISTLNQLSPGSIFEGSINQVENGVVTLGLSNGQTLQARLDQGITLQQGMSMFFQVKSKQDNQIAIRPYNQGLSGNVILGNALEAAGLPDTAKNLEMVNSMMKESMAIDKQSLLDMARAAAGISDNDIATAVTMHKLQIPVTPSNIQQFQNYTQDQNAVYNQLQDMMEGITSQLAGGEQTTAEAVQFFQELAGIFAGEGETGIPNLENPLAEHTLPQSETQAPLEALIENQKHENPIQENQITENQIQGSQLTENHIAETQTQKTDVQGEIMGQTDSTANAAKTVETPEQQAVLEELPEAAAENQRTAGQTGLSQRELTQLTRQIMNVADPELAAKLKQTGINSELTAKELLQHIGKLLSEGTGSESKIKSLLSGKEFQALVRNAMEEQWMVRPEDLKSEHKIRELYERMDQQMEQIENLAKAAGDAGKNLAATAGNIRSNIDFMNQLNQVYTYVQIPLKLKGQNASSELYVYTDKKNLQDPDKELSAFLHLDLDHLGSTDVSVKLYHKQVDTKFYLEDDKSFDLILQNMDQLMERLEKKGYHTQVSVENQKKETDFVQDFLKKDAPTKNGVVHRYSFDVRA